jgi:hypothetical protein
MWIKLIGFLRRLIKTLRKCIKSIVKTPAIPRNSFCSCCTNLREIGFYLRIISFPSAPTAARTTHPLLVLLRGVLEVRNFHF